MSVDGDLQITPQLYIAAWELREQFIRASGPGGQHVNKASTAVQLRWNLQTSALPTPVKARFKLRYGARLTKDGDLVLEVSEHRSQKLNRETARKRLARMIAAVAEPPKRRIATQPSRGAVRRRLASKKQRSDIKAKRGRVRGDEMD